jgi:hypothetical protein
MNAGLISFAEKGVEWEIHGICFSEEISEKVATSLSGFVVANPQVRPTFFGKLLRNSLAEKIVS